MRFGDPLVRSRPIKLSRTGLAKVYGLFALAMAITALGVMAGGTFAAPLLQSGWLFMLFLVELGIIFSAPLWMNKTPLNYLLFGVFPFISGMTITPYLFMVAVGYVNGPAILLNAVASTVLLAGGASIYALTTSRDLAFMGRFLLFSVFGLLGFSLLQLFVPIFRTGTTELLFSGAGVIIFALFTAYDVQRIQRLANVGANPFMLALSLYLDIYNLFLFILRFMVAIGGRR